MDLSVLTVARTLPRHMIGGMEEASWNLATTLAKLGARVTILTSSFDERVRVWEERGVTVHEVPYVSPRLRTKPMYRWWPRFGRSAASYARRTGMRPDVVHVHSLYADGFLRHARRPPVAITVHGTPEGDYRGGARQRLVEKLGPHHPRLLVQRIAVGLATARTWAQLQKADAIVTVSRHVAEMLPGVRSNDPRVSIVPNGVDPSDFPWISRGDARKLLGLDESRTVLLYVGRIDRAKGLESLVDVVRELPNATLLIAGEGPDSDRLWERARTIGVSSRVRLIGPVRSERNRLYAAADLFCLPSMHETGQPPLAVLESMAMGTPVATTGPWIPYELRPFAVVETEPSQLVHRGLALAASVEPRRIREIVFARFTWENAARRYIELFERLLLARSSRMPTPS